MINSNLAFISYRLQDTATYRLKNAHFSHPMFNPKFENVFLDCIAKILHAKSCDTWLINRVVSFPARPAY